MKPEPKEEFSGFLGINTLADEAKLSPREFREASNVDIDNRGLASRRKGTTQTVALGTYHSLWSNGDVMLGVVGSDLEFFYEDMTTKTLRSDLLTGERMSYVDINGVPYYSNGQVIGRVENETSNSLPDPQKKYKIAMKAGHLLEYFKNRLYVARGSVLWFSDPMYFNSVDMRKNFKQFSGYITMIKAVDDGIFISADKTYFMSGRSPDDFSLHVVADYKAIIHTAVRVDGSQIGEDDISGDVIVWTSEKGLCLGANGGSFKNLTSKKYRMPSGIVEGTSLYRENGKGTAQFLTIIQY